MRRKIIEFLANAAGFEVLEGHQLAKMKYAANRLPQSRLPEDIDSMAMKKRLLKDASKPVIFDVGAYIGDTVAGYLEAFADCKIFAFEPTPLSFSQLHSRFSESNQVECFQMALSDRTGRAEINLNEFSPTNSILPAHQLAGNSWGDGLLDRRDVKTVRVETLDEFCKQHSQERIDLLKLDVQGAEAAVLHGASDLLQARNIKLIYLEVIFAPTYEGQSSLWSIDKLMHENGYVLAGIFNGIYGNTVKQADFLYAAGEVICQL